MCLAIERQGMMHVMLYKKIADGDLQRMIQKYMQSRLMIAKIRANGSVKYIRMSSGVIAIQWIMCIIALFCYTFFKSI